MNLPVRATLSVIGSLLLLSALGGTARATSAGGAGCRVPGANLSGSAPVVVMGYSQCGSSATWAGASGMSCSSRHDRDLARRGRTRDA
ncbi:hypothetical protein [Microbispora rosea]|uniref:hypothetical protein n=1 Tax=Microbispora rosea TaxID=58117 RepID=UPI0033CF898E